MSKTSRSPFPVIPAPVDEPFKIASAAGKVGLWDWNIVTNEVKWTASVYVIHGVDPATFEVSLENFIALIHPEDVARVQAQIERALQQDNTYELEFRIRRPDGKTAWVFTNGTVLREGGKPVRMIGATLDVTASHHEDDARARLAAIVASSDDAILSKDLSSIIITWNHGAERLFGYTEQEVVGRPVTILIPPERQDEEPGILERIRRGESIDHYETLRRRKDGSLVAVSLTVSPLRDASGKVVGASQIARDITDRRKAEESLRQSEERFRLLASHAPVGIFLSDPTGACVFVNEQWCAMSGLTQAEAQGDGWARAVHPDDRADVLAGWRAAVQKGEPSTSEFRFLRPDGRIVWLHGSAVQFRDGDRFRGYMGSCVDVTARKQSELQVRFLHELSDKLVGLVDPTDVVKTATAALAGFLGADRCYFFESNHANTLVRIAHDWFGPGLTSLAGSYSLADFGTAEFIDGLGRARYQVSDTATHPTTRRQAAAYAQLQIAALATSAFSQENDRKISLAVTSRVPRVWTELELDLIENVTARVWPIIERVQADEAVRQSEQLYRAIGDSINYGVWICDGNGKNLYASDSFLKLTGYTQAQCANLGWTDLLHPDDVEATAAAWAECVRTGAFWEREHRFKGVDGQYHPILARGVCIRDDAGQIVRWVGINLDISAYKQSQEMARRRQDSLELLHEVGNKLVAEHDLEKLVQLVTDTGREASGAAFGAFFYNVTAAEGESYMLYTLSGVSRDAFAKFPMPRATAMFGPTFRGEGVIRVDDVLADPRYGRSSPHHGMPPGHLPVRSYLAVPVTSRNGEVFGGLFFGHPAVGVFTTEVETVVVALAAQAAIAIDNAKLYAALQKELEEQRRSEARLRDSETRWRQLAEAMPHLVWTCAPDGDCDYLSPQWLTYTGLPEKEQLGRDWLQFVHPDDQSALAAKWNLATAAGTIFDTEFRIRRVDGKYRWFKTRAVPVRDTEGRIVKWYGTNTDIEDVRRIEQAVRKSEHQLRLITDHAPVYLAQCDPEHRFKFVNKPYADRYNLTRDDILGRHVSAITGTDAYATFRVHMENCLAGRRIEFEQEIPYLTLGKRWVHVIYEPERGAEGEVTGLVAVIVDITTRKQAELDLAKARDEALAASRAKDDFLAALSHELRTPLSPVLLVASDAVNNPALPRDIRESFEMIRTNVSLEARLIDDLLDLTRITRGKMPLEMQRVDVHDVLRDALANVRTELEVRHLDLKKDLAAPQAIVLGDPVRLQQVLWNLLKNAVKFTPDGGWIRVATDSTSKPGTILIEVSDSGLGMLPEEIGRVFEAFMQGEHASGTGSHRFGGLGLGLAISQRLVELHSGRISATSAGRNRGSVFVVELPLAAAQQGAQAPQPAKPAPADGGLVASTSILLVEDHASTRETVQKLLLRRNYQVAAAANAAAARALAATQRFDFVVSDVGLPDGDGYQLMAELRALQPHLQGIAVSGYGMDEDLQRSTAAGFSAHLVKPVSITALERALAGLIRPPAV
jgi:PAS domain S-box-containing protein